MPKVYEPEPDTKETYETPAGDARLPESSSDRLTRKFKEEPLVPIGIAATVYALVSASRALQKGNRTHFNRMLRWRVAAQGFTVVAALGGSMYYQQQRQNARKEQQLAKAKQ